MLFIVYCIQLVVQVLSETPPAPPQNIHVDNWQLTWTPAFEEPNVTFTVQYHTFDADKWVSLPGCDQISSNFCNISSAKAEDEHGCVMLRVRANRQGLRSQPLEACSKHGNSCTPQVNLTAWSGTLTVHLDRSQALKYGDSLKHRVYYGKEGEPLTQDYEEAVSSVSFNDLEEGQRYCTKVEYIRHGQPVGPPSCTRCETIPESKKQPKQAVIVVAVVAVLVLGIVISGMAYVFIFQCERIKQWLRPPYNIPDDFLPERLPEHRYAGFTSSPSEEHWDVISCLTPMELRK